MNETIQTLLNRRSIRKYKPEQIKDEELQAVLEAGKYAPTGGGKQRAFFVVVQDPKIRAQITKMNAAVLGANTDPYYGAPTIILVFAELGSGTPLEDASLAIGNMCNAAYCLGLGSCWIHRTKEMFETEEGKALLKEWGIEQPCIGVGSCILGYPEGVHPTPAPRKDNYVYYAK